MLADFLTKPLLGSIFHHLQSHLPNLALTPNDSFRSKGVCWGSRAMTYVHQSGHHHTVTGLLVVGGMCRTCATAGIGCLTFGDRATSLKSNSKQGVRHFDLLTPCFKPSKRLHLLTNMLTPIKLCVTLLVHGHEESIVLLLFQQLLLFILGFVSCVFLVVVVVSLLFHG